MTWLTPIWLVLLAPWAILCWQARRHYRQTKSVPFLQLWPRNNTTAGTRRGVPPIWLIVILVAVLLLILSAAGPARVGEASVVTIVVDRSAGLDATRLAAAEVQLRLPASTRRRVLPVPGEAFDQVGPVDWSKVPATAVRDERAFIATVRRQAGPTVIMTDRDIDLPLGVGAVHPPMFHNAGIDAFGVTVLAAGGQAMVRVFNATAQSQAMVQVDQVKFPIELPAAGQIRDYFIDLPAVGAVCVAKLLTADGRPWQDDVAGDDHAFLVRGGRPATIDAPQGVTDDLRRMIAVYKRQRGGEDSSADAPRLKIVLNNAADGLAVVIPAANALIDNGEVRIDASHPVTRLIDWTGLRTAGRATTKPAGEGWKPLLRAADGTTLLAVREMPTRQVWIGFDTGVLADRADYVVFWTNVFDWLAGAGGYSAEPVRHGLTPVRVADEKLEASPGLYTDGVRQVATFMPAVRPMERSNGVPAVQPGWASESQPLAPWLLAGAMAFLAIGLSLYRGLTRF